MSPTHRLPRTFVPVLATVLLTLALSACYNLQEPVLEKGEYAPVAGPYKCKGPIKSRDYNLKEEKDGVLFPSYTYTSSTDETFLFKKIANDLYLVQIKSPKGYIAAYADLSLSGKVLFLGGDLLGKQPYLQDLASKSSVQIASKGGDPLLIGKKGDVLKFLLSHDKSLLTVLEECQR